MASLTLLRGLRVSLATRPPLPLATRANNTAVMFHTATPLMRPGDFVRLKAKELKKLRPAREEKLRERERAKLLRSWKVPKVSPDSPEGQAMIEASLEKWAEKREKDFHRRAGQKALRREEEKLERENRRNKKGPAGGDLLPKEAKEDAFQGEWEAMEEAVRRSER